MAQAPQADKVSVSTRVFELDAMVQKGNERAALPLAMEMLKDFPVDDEGGMNLTQDTRRHALAALFGFNALDEFERKARDYYKDDPQNLTCQRTLGEALLMNHPARAIPYLQRAHALAADDFAISQKLLKAYTLTNDDVDALKLLEEVLPKNFEYYVGGYEMDWSGPFQRLGRLPELDDIYQKYLKKKGVSNIPFAGDELKRLLPANTSGGQADYLKRIASVDDRRVRWEDRGRLIELLEKAGDGDGVGEQCERLFFSNAQQPAMENWANSPLLPVNSQLRGLWDWTSDDIPYAPGIDVIRAAARAGQISRLLKQAQAEAAAHPKDEIVVGMVPMIAVFGHDPSAPALLEAYNRDVAPSLGARGGQPEQPMYAMLGEFIRWPEQAGMRGTVLRAAFTIGNQAQRGSFKNKERAARLAMRIGDKPYEQQLLNDLVATWPKNLFFEDLAELAHLLIAADLQDKYLAIVPRIADPEQSAQGQQPDSRAEKLANLGEDALDHGWDAGAKLALGGAVRNIESDWDTAAQRSNGSYSVTVNAAAIHLVCDLALRLNATDTFEQIRTLINKPEAWPGSNPALANIRADVERMRPREISPPGGLTPAAWLSASDDAGLTRMIEWDAGARLDSPGGAPENGRFDTDARDWPQLDHQLQLQVLAGPTPENLRVIEIIKDAGRRGTHQVTFSKDDRYLRVICQSSGASPQVDIGSTIPISLGANLMAGGFVRARRYSQEYGADPRPEPLMTLQAVDIFSRPGGPGPQASFQTSGLYDPVELVGPRKEIVAGKTYLQSGWLRGGAQWGIDFLDAKGTKISSMVLSAYGSGNSWHYAQQLFCTGEPSPGGAPSAPNNAVMFEPVLHISRGRSPPCWQELYLGVRDEAPSPPASPNKFVIMQGLADVVSLEEIPEGKILVAKTTDKSIRCFDVEKKSEVGEPLSFPGSAEVTTVNHGSTLVVALSDGTIETRALTGTDSAKIVYHADWPVQLITGAIDTGVIAVASQDGRVAVIDTVSGRLVASLNEGQPVEPALLDLYISPDGKTLCTSLGAQNRFWDAVTGKEIKLRHPTVNLVAIGRFLQINHDLRTGDQSNYGWLQLSNGWTVGRTSNLLMYRRLFSQENPRLLPTGPITAFCLSTQSDDVYVVDPKGELSRWAPPDLADYLSYQVPSGQEVVPVPEEVQSTPEPSTDFAVQVPAKLRGYPDSNLAEPLAIVVTSGGRHGPQGTPIAGADVTISSDFPDATFAQGDSETPDFRKTLSVKTDAAGKANILVHLGPNPGSGSVTAKITAADASEEQHVPINSLNESLLLKGPIGVSTKYQGLNAIITWKDGDDGNEGGFLIERSANGGPWEPIAVVPETVHTYTDPDFISEYRCQYCVLCFIDRKFGYPPKMPSQPDKLASFQP